MCTTFLHLQPEIQETLEGMSDLPQTDLSIAQLLMCIGFFLMYFVEESVHLYLEKIHSNLTLRKSVSISRGQWPNDTHDDTILGQESTNQHLDHHHVDHSHVDHSHILIENNGTLISIRGLLIVLALSIHEMFEGLAVGLEDSAETVWYMFGAVSAHKLVIAFCIGIELVTSEMKTVLVVIYVFIFAIVSPLGIGIGIAISQEGDSTALLSVILQGLASGTLLYVLFFEILRAERKNGIINFFSVLIGFLIMLGIKLIEHHDHDDDHDHEHVH